MYLVKNQPSNKVHYWKVFVSFFMSQFAGLKPFLLFKHIGIFFFFCKTYSVASFLTKPRKAISGYTYRVGSKMPGYFKWKSALATGFLVSLQKGTCQNCTGREHYFSLLLTNRGLPSLLSVHCISLIKRIINFQMKKLKKQRTIFLALKNTKRLIVLYLYY